MGMVDAMVEELKHEATSTRRLLERVPEEHFDWQPHEKSMSLQALASHVVDGISWALPTLAQDEMTIDPETFTPWIGGSVAELLSKFDENVEAAVEAMSAASDERLLQPWTMKVGDQVAFSMPRVVVLRSFVLNHTIHHRGQLDVYLRLKDVPLPQIYGPTADEPDMVMG